MMNYGTNFAREMGNLLRYSCMPARAPSSHANLMSRMISALNISKQMGLLHVAGLLSQTLPSFWRSSPVEDPGYNNIDPATWGGHCALLVGVFDCGPRGRPFESASCYRALRLSPSGP